MTISDSVITNHIPKDLANPSRTMKTTTTTETTKNEMTLKAKQITMESLADFLLVKCPDGSVGLNRSTVCMTDW